MQVVAEWTVSNIYDRPVHLLSAYIERPRVLGLVDVRKVNENIYGRFRIHPGHPTRAAAHFFVTPPVVKEGREFVATVVLVDTYGNRLKVPRLRFRFMGSSSPKELRPAIPDTPSDGQGA